MLPVTRRSTVVVGGSGCGCGEKGDNADNNSCITCANAGDGGCDSEISGGPSASGVCIPRSGIRNTVNSSDDDAAGSMASSRKSLTVEPRQSRAQGIRKLQKCLSTATNHYELDSSSLNNFPTTSLFSSHRTTEIRGYSSTTPQASFGYQNILTNTRQYNSLGSIIQRIIILIRTIAILLLRRPTIFCPCY